MELFWGGYGKSIKIFQLQKKVIQLITVAHKRESCRPKFKKFQILTLASLYIFEMLCFLKKHQGNVKQNLGRNMTYTHDTAAPFCIRRV